LKDKFARKIEYLRLSVTDLCNLRCRYCMPPGGVDKLEHARILRIEELLEIARTASEMGIRKIRLTGGEPLVRKGILSLIRGIRDLPGISTLSLTTNGILLNGQAGILKEAGLDRVNISLDTLDREKFRQITGSDRLAEVLNGLREAREAGLTPLKVNVVLIRDFNREEIPRFAALAAELDLEVRFIELMPLGESAGWTEGRYLSNRAVLEALPGLVRLEETEKGSPAEVWALPEGRGRIGLINPISHKFCGDCNRLRVTSDGRLLPCLHSEEGLDIRACRARGMSLGEIFREGVLLKPREHRLEEPGRIAVRNNMYAVGG